MHLTDEEIKYLDRLGDKIGLLAGENSYKLLDSLILVIILVADKTQDSIKFLHAIHQELDSYEETENIRTKK